MARDAGTPELLVQVGFVASAHDPAVTPRLLPWPRIAERMERCAVREAKDGPGIVFAHFRDPHRKAELVESVTALAYDVEVKADPQPPIPAEIAERCRALNWRAIVCTTYSHQPPERIRARLILALDHSLEPAGYRAAWGLPLRELGLDGFADRACCDPSRLYYLPAAAPERIGHFEHHITEGKPLCAETLLKFAAAERVLRERAAARNQAAVERRRGAPGAYGAAALASACTRIREAAAGTRNATLNREAHGLAQLAAGGEIDTDIALDALARAAEQAGLEPAEIKATLRSAWRAGSAAPRSRGVRS